MFLKELTAVPETALPVGALRDHLRLGTGFADAGAQDVALAAYLRAAIAAIEGRTAKALLARDYRLRLSGWRGAQLALPLAPVAEVRAVRLIDAADAEQIVAPARYRLVQDLARPRIAPRGGVLPAVPDGGAVEVDFTAGFGPFWSDLPADLAQAVMLLAAQYYELRHDGAGAVAAMPFGVAALIEPWRTVRVLGGRG
ncbi:head-tail connector protein [Paenirhodobacter populi]|uniref:Phage gp6-like head-tail connector protein n=1 Tax=Paenirhodobacter populi TaxID=2306993 RepID=A0A443JTP8_9RHOB|nr:hypothetical protein [Sinirhodobacter populi]RWR23890.1 hypothetical protein D2T30_01895 [Sinirhodobacter populi]